MAAGRGVVEARGAAGEVEDLEVSAADRPGAAARAEAGEIRARRSED